MFLSAIDEEYKGDRKKASTDLAARGWQYLRESNVGDAMRRFNQAWLLNPNNGEALWGMAAVPAGSGQFEGARKIFDEAEHFADRNISFSVDYAKFIAMAAVQRNDKSLLKDALSPF